MCVGGVFIFRGNYFWEVFFLLQESNKFPNRIFPFKVKGNCRDFPYFLLYFMLKKSESQERNNSLSCIRNFPMFCEMEKKIKKIKYKTEKITRKIYYFHIRISSQTKSKENGKSCQFTAKRKTKKSNKKKLVNFRKMNFKMYSFVSWKLIL